MFRRLWQFAKRHRKKLIFTAACAGGAYYVWKIWLPRFQQQLLQKLLKESLELTRGEEEEKEKKANFTHTQQVSDAYVRKSLAALQERHKDLFAVEECSEKVKRAETKEARLQRFQELLIECLSRLVSAPYTLSALLLLHRVEFNIVGRELAGVPGCGEAACAGAAVEAGTEVHAAFLDSTRFLKEEGIHQIADAVRRAVRNCLESSKLAPTAAVTAHLLEKFLLDVCNEAHSELLLQSRIVAMLLPESVDREVAEEHRTQVKQLLDEARDYVESPQFLEVFKTVCAMAAQRLAGAFGDGALDPVGAPLAGGQSCPLAKLNGLFVELSKTMLDEGTDFIAHFAGEPVVDELCQGLYFQESGQR
mmetsp:Transcript_118823/g.331488  ORF Transcript_118823/g.331488 Transcript_118823/m.331488 type:complete len:363 (+) Transcript_118823:110-1198(+)